MRKMIARLAVSADGFIARKDGSFDWLDRPQPRGNYGFGAFMASIDTIVWGRKTYDQAVALSGNLDLFGEGLKHIVFTHRPAKPAKNVEFIRTDPGKFAKKMRAARGKDIWLMGGGGLYASFLDAAAIDEFGISVVPVLIGEGIPLLSPARRTVELKLLATKRFSDGIIHLRYKVLKHA